MSAPMFKGARGGMRMLDPCLPATDMCDPDTRRDQEARRVATLKANARARRIAKQPPRPPVRVQPWEPLTFEEFLCRRTA